jgi:hypothetical protein
MNIISVLILCFSFLSSHYYPSPSGWMRHRNAVPSKLAPWILLIVASKVKQQVGVAAVTQDVSRFASTECSYTGSNCRCDNDGFVAGKSCNVFNAAACVDGCAATSDTCRATCSSIQEDCGDNCVDIGSFQCVCNCLGRARDCQNECARAYNSCTCGCRPPTARPSRSPSRDEGAPSRGGDAPASISFGYLASTSSSMVAAIVAFALHFWISYAENTFVENFGW